jgi:hypothetical protein
MTCNALQTITDSYLEYRTNWDGVPRKKLEIVQKGRGSFAIHKNLTLAYGLQIFDVIWWAINLTF